MAAVLTAVAAIAMPSAAGAVQLQAGDILVTSLQSPGTQSLAQVDPKTGAQTLIAGAPQLVDPAFAAVTPNGQIDLTDFAADSVDSVDPATGAVRTVYHGADPNDFSPLGLGLAPDGRIIVALPATGEIVAIDPTTGARSHIVQIPTGGLGGLAVTPGGPAYVADSGNPQSLWAVNLSAGSATPVVTKGALLAPEDVAVSPSGAVFVADAESGIVQVDPSKGTQQVVLSALRVNSVAWSPTGALVFTQFDNDRPLGQVLSFDPRTGALKTISSGNLVGTPFAAEVVPPLCSGQFATIVGGPKADKLIGTPFDDVIAGVGGNDRIKAKAGNDRICGGSGQDTVLGGAGRDRIKGEGGNDRLSGGKGKDRLIGGKGRDAANQ
jgi:Ca2+-binding RTX toxin-like protein